MFPWVDVKSVVRMLATVAITHSSLRLVVLRVCCTDRNDPPIGWEDTLRQLLSTAIGTRVARQDFHIVTKAPRPG